MGGGGVTGNQIVQQIAKTAGLQFGEIYLFDSSQDYLGIIQTKVLEVVFFFCWYSQAVNTWDIQDVNK